MNYSDEQYRDLIQLLILGDTGMISDGDYNHGFIFETEGDGWNEPEIDTFSCCCEQWEGFQWIQADPERSGRPNLEDMAMKWREHIINDVWKIDEEEEFDGDVSQDSDLFDIS